MASIEHPSSFAAEEEALSQLPPVEEWTPLEVRNHMQFALMISHGESIEDFTDERHPETCHAKIFGDNFDAHADELIAAYRANPAETLHRVAEQIYH